jgi:hypothetical protein
VGNRSKEYRIQGHHDRAQASTKNVMSGYLLIKDTRSSPPDPLPRRVIPIHHNHVAIF